MTKTRRLLLIDPNPTTRASLEATIVQVDDVHLIGFCAAYDEAVQDATSSSAELAMVVLDSNPAKAFELLHQLHLKSPQLSLLPASTTRDGETILKALRAGAHEFLPLPCDAQELSEAARRLLPDSVRVGECLGKIVTIIGAAGGVGCTTLAVNLACALAEYPQYSVALVDLDLLLGSISTLLDVLPEQSIADVASDIDRYDETLLRRALHRHSTGVHVLPAPTTIDDVARVEPEAARQALDLLKGAFDFVIVDTSKGFQATDLLAIEMSDELLLVAQLEVCGLRNSARLMQVLRQIDGITDRVRVIINRVGSDVTLISLKKAEETLGAPIAWNLPNASELVSASRAKGAPLSAMNANAKIVRSIQEIANSYIPEDDRRAEPKRRKKRFANLFA